MFKKLAEIDFLDSMRMKISGVRFLNFPVDWVAKKNHRRSKTDKRIYRLKILFERIEMLERVEKECFDWFSETRGFVP